MTNLAVNLHGGRADLPAPFAEPVLRTVPFNLPITEKTGSFASTPRFGLQLVFDEGIVLLDHVPPEPHSLQGHPTDAPDDCHTTFITDDERTNVVRNAGELVVGQ